MKQTKTMRHTIARFIIVIACLTGALANLQATDYGLGVIIGEPTGLSFKINNFPVLGVAWSFGGYVHTQVDFWFFSRLLQEPVWWYLGIGGKVRFNAGDNPTSVADPLQVGVRVPIGLQLIFEERYEIFLELAPGMKLFEGTAFALDGGLGFRYHFLGKK